MDVDKLLDHWKKAADNPLSEHAYNLYLPRYDAARVAALVELFPGVSEQQILADLLTAALEQVSAGLKYSQGSSIASYDEQDDPIYSDAGLTPRFLALVDEHLQRLNQ